MIFRPVNDCRLCLAKVHTVFELTPTPIANNFAPAPDTFAMRFPLELRQCGNCGHVQIGTHIDGERLFTDYLYATPEAERVRLAAQAQALRSRYPQATPEGKRQPYVVLEIGSNNGIFIDELRKAGLYAVGMDPSPLAPASGMPKWFSTKSAKNMLYSMGKMKLIVANNVFAHVDDLRNVFLGMKYLLDDDGAIVFEVQYLPALVAGGMFDMIYHEHKDYHTLSPLPAFVAKFGFHVSEVEHIPTHGGSIRVHVRQGDKPSCEMPEERIDWDAFRMRIDRERERITRTMDGYGKVAVFGAPAKACTLLHHFGLTERIAYCVDETPSKQGRYLPGTAIQIVGTERLRSDPPDAVLITAWNYAHLIAPRIECDVIVPFTENVTRPNRSHDGQLAVV